MKGSVTGLRITLSCGVPEPAALDVPYPCCGRGEDRRRTLHRRPAPEPVRRTALAALLTRGLGTGRTGHGQPRQCRPARRVDGDPGTWRGWPQRTRRGDGPRARAGGRRRRKRSRQGEDEGGGPGTRTQESCRGLQGAEKGRRHSPPVTGSDVRAHQIFTLAAATMVVNVLSRRGCPGVRSCRFSKALQLGT